MELFIIAGGKGTRLGVQDIPKPMIRVNEKPILEYQIELAKRYGITDITILTGYLSEKIEEYFGSGESFGVKIRYIKEKKALGTAGALKQIENLINERFLVFYGDLMMDIDLKRFINFDSKYDTLGTLIIHPNDHPYDCDLVAIEESSNLIEKFYPKHRLEGCNLRNLVNAAVYILDPKILKYISIDKLEDFGKDVFPKVIENNDKLAAYITSEYIKDMGTPDRLLKVESDYNSGKIANRNLEKKQKAVFLDRDGIINKEIDGVLDKDQLIINTDAIEFVKKINSSEYLAIIVTNQPIIAKGFCTKEVLYDIHAKMETIFGSHGAFFDNIYYCPHHPEKGFDGEISELKIDCNCRKPNIGMFEFALDQFNIDPAQSFMFGDRISDMQASINSKLKYAFLLDAPYNKKVKTNEKYFKRINTLEETFEMIFGGGK